MNRARAEQHLARLGFVIDWSCSGPNPDGGWAGTIDAVGRGQIDGDCRGEVVFGDNATDFYRNAIAAAVAYAEHGPNAVCENPDCDFHAEN